MESSDTITKKLSTELAMSFGTMPTAAKVAHIVWYVCPYT